MVQIQILGYSSVALRTEILPPMVYKSGQSIVTLWNVYSNTPENKESTSIKLEMVLDLHRPITGT